VTPHTTAPPGLAAGFVLRKKGIPPRDVLEGAEGIVTDHNNEPTMSVAQEAAEHARRLLNRPGLRHVVTIAETIKTPDPIHSEAALTVQTADRPSSTGSDRRPTP
jgi:hypothetical protein